MTYLLDTCLISEVVAKYPNQKVLDWLDAQVPETLYNYLMTKREKLMTLTNYNFNGFTINLYVDEQGDWLAHFQEMPNVSAFGDTPPEALEELKLAWELVKEDYQEKGKDIPVAPVRKKFSSLI